MLTSTPCTEIAPATVDWLWEPYLARGKLAILDGDPGTGKSFVALDLAARLSRGGPLPCGRPLDRPHTTLLLSAEDHAADTIRPRLSAAGADLSHIHVVTALGIDLSPLPQFPADLPALEQLVRVHAADLIILDPLLSFFPHDVWANSDQSVRRALTPLAVMASDTRCAVLCVRHLTKSGGSKAIYRGGGSISIVGVMRTGLLLASHPDDEKLLVMATSKTNAGPPGRSLGLRLEPGDSGHTVVRWCDPLDLTANELCTKADRVRPRDRARGWLKEQLATGRRRATEIEAAARVVGIAYSTLVRAKDALAVVSEQVYEGAERVWWWRDPSAGLGNPFAELEPLDDRF